MKKFLVTAAAGMAALGAGVFAANAAPTGTSTINSLSSVSNVALCFYIDGWNGPGMYDCGFRTRRGHGWHGKRHDDSHRAEHRDDRQNDRHDGKKKFEDKH